MDRNREGKVSLVDVELNSAVPALKNRQIDGFGYSLYFDEWLGYGVFFLTVAVLQVMFSMALGPLLPAS